MAKIQRQRKFCKTEGEFFTWLIRMKIHMKLGGHIDMQIILRSHPNSFQYLSSFVKWRTIQ